MATVKLDLVPGIWQEVGSFGFIMDKDRVYNVEVANADSLPTGVVPCHVNRRDDLQHFVPPASGSWYVRSAALAMSITYTEV